MLGISTVIDPKRMFIDTFNDNMPGLVKLIACCQTGALPLSGPAMTYFNDQINKSNKFISLDFW